ncbi:MAG: TolC family protein [Kiritimatiellia bacterium]
MEFYQKIIVVVSVVLAVSGCISDGKKGRVREAASENNIIFTDQTRAQCENDKSLFVNDDAEELSLEQVMALALMKNPSLESYSYSMRAAEARILQSRVFPNPGLELEIESLGRDGKKYSETAEPGIMLGQLIELGGKRRARIDTARAKGELAALEYECRKIDVMTAATLCFTDVLFSQQRLELADGVLSIAEQTSRTVDERVKAGKESPVQSSKADAELELARLEYSEAQTDLDTRRRALSMMWGAEDVHFKTVSGSTGIIKGDIPDLGALQGQLDMNPELVLADARVKISESELSVEKAARIPDVTVGAGVKQFEEDDTHALIVGIGLPLPLFDRNEGNIAAAEHELARADADRRAVKLDVLNRLADAYSVYVSSRNRAYVLQSKVVTAAERIYDSACTGYKEGKLELLDVLDAQRSLYEVKEKLISTLHEYHKALCRIDRIAGKNIFKFAEERN